MEYIATMIPVAVAVAIALVGEYRKGSSLGFVLLASLGVIILLRFAIIALTFDGLCTGAVASFVEVACSVYAIPLMYSYLCEQCGTRWDNNEARIMAILSLSPLFAPILRPYVIFLNCIIIALCMYRLKRRMSSLGLSFTKPIGMYFVWMFLLLGFTVASFAFNMHENDTHHIRWVFFGVNSFIITAGFLYIPHSFKVSPVVDKASGKHVSLDEFVITHNRLSEELDRRLVEGKAYLNPGITIDELASQMGTNRVYVTRLMQMKFGKTFNDYVNCARVDYSKGLLESSDLSVEDVAFDSGFQSSSSYCRVFKKITGVTPGSWRSSHS